MILNWIAIIIVRVRIISIFEYDGRDGLALDRLYIKTITTADSISLLLVS